MKDWILFNGHYCKRTEYDGYYASEFGEIITIKIKGGQGSVDYNHPREHSYKIDRDGYKEVCLSIIQNGIHKRIYKRAHRLIWETFMGPIPLEFTIDHIDCNKLNNNLSNLRLLTREENTSIANLNKPSKSKYVYALFQNNIFCGIYDRNELSHIFNLNTKFWYNKNIVLYFKSIGFDIEFLGSVEDIEKIVYY